MFKIQNYSVKITILSRLFLKSFSSMQSYAP